VGISVDEALVAVGKGCSTDEPLTVGKDVSGGAREVTNGVGELNPGMTQPERTSARKEPAATRVRTDFLIGTSCGY
jgi:hypothetical protein